MTLPPRSFRDKKFLLHLRERLPSEFQPKFFVDTSLYYEKKLAALTKHESQSHRIKTTQMKRLSDFYSSKLGFKFTEAFDIFIQEGAEEKIKLILELNDCPFHKFWYGLIDNRQLIIIHAIPVYRKRKEWNWSTDKDREGMTILRRAFGDMWHGRDPIEDYSCGTSNVVTFLDRNDILLSGGAVSNNVTREYFNQFSGIRYVINYTMPDYKEIRIYDKKSGKPMFPEYEDDELGNRTPVKDIGILTVMRNPMNEERCLIGCMGIHGFGSLGCYKAISDRLLLKELMGLIDFPLRTPGYQILVDYRIREGKSRLRHKSLHPIK